MKTMEETRRLRERKLLPEVWRENRGGKESNWICSMIFKSSREKRRQNDHLSSSHTHCNCEAHSIKQETQLETKEERRERDVETKRVRNDDRFQILLLFIPFQFFSYSLTALPGGLFIIAKKHFTDHVICCRLFPSSSSSSSSLLSVGARLTLIIPYLSSQLGLLLKLIFLLLVLFHL